MASTVIFSSLVMSLIFCQVWAMPNKNQLQNINVDNNDRLKLSQRNSKNKYNKAVQNKQQQPNYNRDLGLGVDEITPESQLKSLETIPEFHPSDSQFDIALWKVPVNNQQVISKSFGNDYIPILGNLDPTGTTYEIIEDNRGNYKPLGMDHLNGFNINYIRSLNKLNEEYVRNLNNYNIVYASRLLPQVLPKADNRIGIPSYDSGDIFFGRNLDANKKDYNNVYNTTPIKNAKNEKGED